MIRGTVTATREPVVRLQVRGPAGAVADVGLVVDGGFTGDAVHLGGGTRPFEAAALTPATDLRFA